MKKSYWTDSNQIFFSPKLSLEGKNMLPQIVDLYIPSQQNTQQQQNFLTVFKKPIVNVYDRITHTYSNSQNANYFRKHQDKKQKRPVCVVGQTKQFQKRTYTTNHKKRNITADYQMIEKQKIKEGCEQIILLRNYRQTITQVASVPKKAKKSQKRIYNPQKPSQNSQYYYFVGQGNNSQLIESIMRRRMNWQQTTSSIFHFRWQQARPKYHSIQTINKQLHNHLPNHEAISDKCSLVKNLKVFCEKNQQYLFKIIPVCFQFNFGDLDLCEVEIKRFLQFYWENNQKNGRFGIDMKEVKEEQNQNEEGKKFGRSSSMKKRKDQESTCQSPKKSINSKRQSTKSSHNKNFRSHKKQSNAVNQSEAAKKKEQIKILHRSLLAKIKSHYLFQDMSNLKKQNPYLAPLQSEIYGTTSLWLLKPADLNRGRGIHLFRTIEELGDLLKSELSHHEKSSYIIQKYIEKPLLIDNRKFDIRVFAMITHNRQLFIFKEGYIRTSSTPYDLHSKSYFSHLTNNAIQKNSKKYGEYQQGNILELDYLFKNNLIKKDGFFEEMKRLIRASMRSGYDGEKMFTYQDNSVKNNSLISNFSSFQTSNANKDINKIKNFEIFGYDFMLDINGHMWIIEVNTNPSIELSSKWLKAIIPRMLDDAFKLTIDKLFSKGRDLKQNANVHYPVDGYSNNQNLWEFMELKNEIQTSRALV